ncbi:MAG TPA: ABC transporter substrate-binding protein [Chloroflexota bacterium]|nr:ABC transporter substrate-binding protein [Chloroflexota bacterium]
MRLGNGRRRGWAAGLVALGVALAACGPAASQAPGQPPNSGGSTPAQPPNSGIAPAQAPNTAGSAPAQPANPAGSAAAAPGSPAAAGATARPAPEAVTVSWVNSLTIAPFFVAADRGYFEEQGIDLKLEQVQSAADAIAFLATGQLDASFGAVAVALYNAINQGLNVRVAAPIAYDNPELLVRKALWDSGAVRTIPDLRGRQVYTVAPGSGVAYLRIKTLQLAGLSDDEVEHVSVALPDAPLAMTNGAIDAAFFPEPWHTRVLTQGIAVVLDDHPLPNEVLTITAMAGARLLRERTDLGGRWATALLKGIRDMQSRDQIMSDDTVAIMARWTGLQPDVLRQMRHLPRFDPNYTVDGESLLDQQRVHMAAGAISYTQPLPLDQIVDPRLAEYAVQQLGRK